MYKVTMGDNVIEVNEGATYHELALEYEKEHGVMPYLVRVDDTVKELRRHIRRDEKIEFLFFDNDTVRETYTRTAIFILLKSIYEAYDKKLDAGLKFRIKNGYYFEVEDEEITEEKLKLIKENFDKTVESKFFIQKTSYQKQDALDIFRKNRMEDAMLLFQYNYKPVINIRTIDYYVKYINGILLYDTSYITHYELRKFKKGIFLIVPDTEDVTKVEFTDPGEKIFNIHNVSVDWAKKLQINTVGKLNDSIARGNFNDLVIMTESFQDKLIGDIASEIKNSGKRLILVAGPSSSGKTSFSHRLMYHMRAVELNPYPVSCDDFFKERSETPVKANGEYDFETIDAVDINLLNKTLNGLLNHEETVIPRFDFEIGTKTFKRTPLKLSDNDVIILEGIHCLNPALLSNVDQNSIYKIYISALTEVCIDNANRIATSDLRLMRRLVRDQRTRGISPKTTLKLWKNVREGEEKYIFPFQERADILINSALIYEFSVLKLKALPMLYRLTEDKEVSEIARRLIKILNYFLAVDTDVIPRYSIIREFIGNSVLEVG
ncbi:MAG: nucleoside kinase [Lachnospiraceae bacterium]|nr:nucleoside kinase [Lachnospiraceae bacterium]